MEYGKESMVGGPASDPTLFDGAIGLPHPGLHDGADEVPAGPAQHGGELHDRQELPSTPAALALRYSVLYDGKGAYAQELPIRDAVIKLGAQPVDETRRERAARGLNQFGELVDELRDTNVGSPTEIAADLHKVLGLFRWTGALAPDLTPAISGEWALGIPSILRLADLDSPWIQEQLARFDEPGEKTALGVYLLTEMDLGSNTIELGAEVIVDAEAGTATLNTPKLEACKCMPNVDDLGTGRPIMGIVAARVKMAGAPEGEDEGIFPVLIPLDGSIEGTHIYPMSDSITPMGNAVTYFDNAKLPLKALMLGDIARITPEGTFGCDLPKRERFQATIAPLMLGRNGLPITAIQSTAAGLNITKPYFENRDTAGGVKMMERDHIPTMVAESTATLYAAAALARFVSGEFIDPAVDQGKANLLAMVLKPFATYASFNILQELRERTSIQGMFRINRIPDYLNNVQGAITAEGENQLLEISVARTLRAFGMHGDNRLRLEASGKDEPRSEWHDMLLRRENAFGAKSLDPKHPNEQNINYAKTVSARLAADALYATKPPEDIRELVADLADVFAIQQIMRDPWFGVHGLLDDTKWEEMQAARHEKNERIIAQLPDLLDAFGIPEIDAPMAQPDYPAAWLRHLGASGVLEAFA